MSRLPIDPETFETYTGYPEFHSVLTIELGELVESGIFTWERIDWRDAAYSQEQYERLCEAFLARFWLDEISVTPVGAWFRLLRYTLVYELMPKYKPLYAQLESGDYDPLQTGGEYRKEIRIDSDFPETLLNGNRDQDYASKGYAFEAETVGRGNMADDYANYVEKFRSIDAMILDEIERKLFNPLWTTNVNMW